MHIRWQILLGILAVTGMGRSASNVVVARENCDGLPARTAAGESLTKVTVQRHTSTLRKQVSGHSHGSVSSLTHLLAQGAGNTKQSVFSATSVNHDSGDSQQCVVGEDELVISGRTLAEWRLRLKNLDPQTESATADVPGLIAIVQNCRVPSITRRQAALTLGRIGEPASSAVAVLAEIVGQECLARVTEEQSTTSDCIWAGKALALFGAHAADATPQLVLIMQNGEQPLVHRLVCLEAVARIGAGHPQAIPAILRLINSGDAANPQSEASQVREAAIDSISLIGPPAAVAVPALMRATRDGNERIRRKSVLSLGAIRAAAEPAVSTIAERLIDDESAAVRDAAGESLAKIGAGALPVLLYLLAEPEVEYRWRAADSLGQMGRPALPAIVLLEQRLADADAIVQISSAEAIWKITGDSAKILPSVIHQFENEDRQIRLRAARLIVSLGPQARAAVVPLRRLLKDSRSHVRLAAEKTLANIEANMSEKEK